MWWEGLIGGILLGIATAIYLHLTGRITGISGIVNGLVFIDEHSVFWKSSWLAGLLSAAAMMAVISLDKWFISSDTYLDGGAAAYAIGGFLVGFGTRYGNGCTSGHGICGLSRASPRSIIAVILFMTTGFLTATVFNMHGWLLKESGDQIIRNEPHLEVSYAIFALAAAVLVASVAMRRTAENVKDTIASYLMGLLFGVGLAVGGMSKRSKIIGFLNITRDWDPQLAFVMGGGVLVAIVAFWWAGRREKTFWGYDYSIPGNRVITFRLVVGSWLFGTGWGLTGLCPGPAVMQVAAGFPLVGLFFLPAMLLGMAAVRGVEKMEEWMADRKLKRDKVIDRINTMELNAAHAIFEAAAHMTERKEAAARAGQEEDEEAEEGGPEKAAAPLEVEEGKVVDMAERGEHPTGEEERGPSPTGRAHATRILRDAPGAHHHTVVAPEHMGITIMELLERTIFAHTRDTEQAMRVLHRTDDCTPAPAPAASATSQFLESAEEGDDVETRRHIAEAWRGPWHPDADY